MAEAPPEFVDALFGEEGFHEGMAVTHEDFRQDLDHDHSHVPSQGHGHLQIPSAEQLRLISLW